MNTLDKFDLAILTHLQADGRLTNAELAQRVGLSAAPCWRRVRALEQAGYIRGYHAEIDRQKIGLGVLAFVRIDAEISSGARTREMEEAIRAIPEVIACHYISGKGMFELQVVAKDLESFSHFTRTVLLNLPNVRHAHQLFAGRGQIQLAAGAHDPLNPLKTAHTAPSIKDGARGCRLHPQAVHPHDKAQPQRISSCTRD